MRRSATAHTIWCERRRAPNRHYATVSASLRLRAALDFELLFKLAQFIGDRLVRGAHIGEPSLETGIRIAHIKAIVFQVVHQTGDFESKGCRVHFNLPKSGTPSRGVLNTVPAKFEHDKTNSTLFVKKRWVSDMDAMREFSRTGRKCLQALMFGAPTSRQCCSAHFVAVMP
ncbi:MAG: hypothetical protein AAGJ70_00265 [Pseudomonadota bacterium]